MKTKLNFTLLILLTIVMTTCKKDIGNGFSVGNSSLLGGAKAMAQCEILPETIIDISQPPYNASPDDNIDDTQAFIRAAQYISAMQAFTNPLSNTRRVVLYLPWNGWPLSHYLVGLQLVPGQSITIGNQTFTNPLSGPGAVLRMGLDILSFTCVQNVTIRGGGNAPNTKIDYNDNLYFGTFSATMQPINNQVPPLPFTEANKCYLCNFIRFVNCGCMYVENIALNGNAQYYWDHNQVGTAFMQLRHVGVSIESSKDISVSDSYFNEFCLDGIAIQPTGGACACYNPENINLIRLDLNRNCRTGIGWVGGNNIYVEKCHIWYSGQVFCVTGGPCSGMDVEPEIHCTQGRCTNSTFYLCEFVASSFCALISDDHPVLVDNINFNNCLFASTAGSQHSLWPKRMSHTKFNDCTIYGGIVHCAGPSTNDRLEFNRCTVTDEDFVLNGMPVHTVPYGFILLDFGWGYPDAYYFSFFDCDFRIHHNILIYQTDIPPAYGYERIFDHNRFHMYYNDIRNTPGMSQVNAYIGRFTSCKLTSNHFIDEQPAANIPAIIDTYFFEITLATDNAGCGIPLCVSDGNNDLIPHSSTWSHFVRNHDSTCFGYGDYNNF